MVLALGAIKHLADLNAQTIGREGLLDEVCSLLQHSMMHDYVSMEVKQIIS